MSKKKKTNDQLIKKIVEEQQYEKSNYLIICGVLLALTSIGLLIFVLSEKIFHLS